MTENITNPIIRTTKVFWGDFNGDVNKNYDELLCVCGQCRKRFPFEQAQIKKRKFYNKEIEEKVCPYCGSKGFSPAREIYWLANMASHHHSNGQGGKGTT